MFAACIPRGRPSRVTVAMIMAALALLWLAGRPALAFDPQTAPAVSATAYFNAPQDGDADGLLEQRLIALIDSVPAGATLRGAFYSWSRQNVARAVVRAHARGVDVKLVLDGGNVTSSGRPFRAVARLQDGLGARLRECGDGAATACIGSGIQHNKFLLASELADGRRHVIWQSSANPTRPQRRLFNDAIVLDGDLPLFTAMMRYWDALYEHDPDPAHRESAQGSGPVRVYFFPRETGDTVVDILDRVICDDGGQIHVAMAYFTGPRGAIARRLAARVEDGCDVAVIVRQRQSGAGIRRLLQEGGVNLWVFSEDADHTVHSKYMLINAPMSDSPLGPLPVQVVVTGSHNYTGPALRRHDETLFEIADSALHAAYLENWTLLRDRVDAQ